MDGLRDYLKEAKAILLRETMLIPQREHLWAMAEERDTLQAELASAKEHFSRCIRTSAHDLEQAEAQLAAVVQVLDAVKAYVAEENKGVYADRLGQSYDDMIAALKTVADLPAAARELLDELARVKGERDNYRLLKNSSEQLCAMTAQERDKLQAHTTALWGLLNEALITMRNYYGHAISRAAVEEFITKAQAALRQGDV